MLTREALAFVVALTCLIAAPASAAPDDANGAAPSTASPVQVHSDIRALRGVLSTINVDVPDGLDPMSFKAVLRRDSPELEAEVSVNGTVVHRSKGSADGVGKEAFTAQIPAADRTDDTLVIGLRYRDYDGSDVPCRVLQPTFASLTDINVTYRGRESAPTSVGDFFPQQSPVVLVQIPRRADDGVAEAGLTAVAALARRYPATTSIRLQTGDRTLPKLRTGARIVRIEPGHGRTRAVISRERGWPVLTLTGRSDLTAAAAALGDPALTLASGPTAQDLSLTPTKREKRHLRHPLSDVVVGDRLTLTGYGTTTGYLQVPQDLFGGPISALKLHLIGAHTAVPRGGHIQLDILANDLLVDSVSFGSTSKSRFGLTSRVPTSALRGTNAIVLRMSAIPGGGSCTSDLRDLPVEVHVDLADSTVTAAPGPGELVGFSRFPQTLKGLLPIAIRGTQSTTDADLRRAAALVVPLQRAAVQPLEVVLAPPEKFLDGSQSGLLVGASRADAERLDAPLRLAEARVMTYVDSKFHVLTNRPFVALEAFHQDDRDVLLLGGWNVSTTSYATLANRLTTQAAGHPWESLSDDIFVATGKNKPFSLNSNSVIPQPDRIDAKRDFARWFLGGVAVLLVLLGANALLVRRRRRKIGRLIDAQESAGNRDAPPPA